MTSDPQSSRKQQHTASKSASHSNPSQADGFYGHEDTARMSAAFISHLFSCPDVPPPSNTVTPSGAPAPSPKLANFVAYALHRTRLTSSVTYAALYLLQRLKTRFPAARGSSGHRLFISAFMIASKVVCDDTYSNKSWAVVGQGMFSLREINQMEREMCGYLEWQLNIGGPDLETFSDGVTEKFGSPALFATYMRTKPAPTPIILAANAAAAEAAAAQAQVVVPSAASTLPAVPAIATHSPTLRPIDTAAAAHVSSKHHRAQPSPATILSNVDEDGEMVRERSGETDEDEDEDAESPSRSSASSSPESDMVSTPTSIHGEDSHARTHVVSHDSHHHHHHLGASSSKLVGGAASIPPVVKVEANVVQAGMAVRESVW